MNEHNVTARISSASTRPDFLGMPVLVNVPLAKQQIKPFWRTEHAIHAPCQPLLASFEGGKEVWLIFNWIPLKYHGADVPIDSSFFTRIVGEHETKEHALTFLPVIRGHEEQARGFIKRVYFRTNTKLHDALHRVVGDAEGDGMWAATRLQPRRLPAAVRVFDDVGLIQAWLPL